MRLLLPILILFSISVTAQETEIAFRKFDIGASFGLNVSNVLAKSKDTVFSKDFSPRVTGHFGMRLIYNPFAFLSIRSGFTFNIRGYKLKEDIYFGSSTPVESEFIFSSVYIDFPLVAQFNIMPDVENGGMFFRGGGYYGIAIGGGTAVKTDDQSSFKQTSPQNFSIGNSKTDDLRKEDYGVTLGWGFEFRTFEVALAWDIGLANISNDTSNGLYANNRLFRIDVVVFVL
ncbi:MAG: hypothetical protein ACJAV5_000508 [Vicingaceae bacterium]|jgi:hypothetical protein